VVLKQEESGDVLHQENFAFPKPALNFALMRNSQGES